MFRATVAAVFGLCAMLGAAGAQSVLDVGAVPSLNAQARASYAIFLRMNLPRAAAVSSGGGIGWSGGNRSLDDARTAALKGCAAKGAGDCAVYAEDLQVVWRGAAPVALPPVPGPLIQTSRYAFVPDPRYFWHGPQAARGVVVWGHGKGNGNDYRANQPPPVIRAFNNGGFDVVRFGRDPSGDYADWAQDWLRQGLTELRRQGYRFVVSSGQSRGANDALFMLGSAGVVDAVIALSPGSYGVAFSAEFSRSLHEAAAPSARVVFAQFEHDPYRGTRPCRTRRTGAQYAPAGSCRSAVDRSANRLRWPLRRRDGRFCDQVRRLHLPVRHRAASLVRTRGADLQSVAGLPYGRAGNGPRHPAQKPLACHTDLGQ